MNESDALKALQARFPDAGIRFSHIGNTYGDPGTSAWRDDRAHFVLTKLTEAALGPLIALPLPHGPHDINVEEISLALQNRIVHSARARDRTLQSCPCDACTIRRLRATYERCVEKS